MAIQYKVDLLAALKAAGYSSYRLRKEKLLGEATIQRIRQGEPVSWENVSTICKLMACQPGDFLEYVPDKQHQYLKSPPGISFSPAGFAAFCPAGQYAAVIALPAATPPARRGPSVRGPDGNRRRGPRRSRRPHMLRR